MDLMLLAETQSHAELLSCIDDTIRLLVNVLLPSLGSAPLSSDLASKPEVLDFVGVVFDAGKEA